MYILGMEKLYIKGVSVQCNVTWKDQWCMQVMQQNLQGDVKIRTISWLRWKTREWEGDEKFLTLKVPFL